jgi:hypothetical protein
MYLWYQIRRIPLLYSVKNNISNVFKVEIVSQKTLEDFWSLYALKNDF